MKKENIRNIAAEIEETIKSLGIIPSSFNISIEVDKSHFNDLQSNFDGEKTEASSFLISESQDNWAVTISSLNLQIKPNE